MMYKKIVFKIKKVGKFIFYSVFGIIVLFISIIEISLSTQKYLMKSAVPTFLGYGSFIVATGSMNGTINVGDMIIIKKTNDYQLGDIITFIESEATTPVTHRIVDYGVEETFITKGDANNIVDSELIHKNQIVGEVVFVISGVGIFLSWLISFGWIFIIGTCLILISMIYILKKKRKRYNNDYSLESRN